jgi:bifunctional DNA-binding transcriptional regulator/antitoxin component of YhaV-PrlF toxin-antitoxin module
MESSIDRFGRLLIPKALRDILGLRPQTRVRVTVRGNELIVDAVEVKSQLEIAPDGLPLLHGEAEGMAASPLRAHREARHQKLVDGA